MGSPRGGRERHGGERTHLPQGGRQLTVPNRGRTEHREPSSCSPGLEEVASEELEPGFEDSAEDAPSEEDSEVSDVICSEELDVCSDDEPSEGRSWGWGELLSEELESTSSEDEASPWDVEELSEESEELLSEDGGPEPEALPVQP